MTDALKDRLSDIAPRTTFGRRFPHAPATDRLSSAPRDQTFTVPVEMAVMQATATSLMFITRAKEMGATLHPTAVVWRVGRRLVARIDFLVPVGPENWSEQMIQLSTPLWETLGC